ncbi:MAG: ComF family protein [Thermosynechococcaceae cyanobacterium MS004]|nr:ComF family protein [Thermosynechococcaceae cyanobacterium MS004]
MTRRFSARLSWANLRRNLEPSLGNYLGQTVLEFIFPSPCPLCQRKAEAVFCKDCTGKILDGRRLNPQVAAPDLPPLYCWGHYDGTLKQSLARLKYDRNPQVAKPLGQWLAELWHTQASSIGHPGSKRPGSGRPIVVPIPLHPERQQQRGYNQAALIAHSFCQHTGLSLRSQGLSRTRATTAQYGLSRLERYQNLQRAFSLGPDFTHPSRFPSDQAMSRGVILIDDIFTTGATLKAAVNTLQKHEIPVTALLAIAAAERSPTE